MSVISIPRGVWRLMGVQLVVGSLFALLLTPFNLAWGYSALMGAVALVLPSGVAALFAFRSTNKRQGGELLASLMVGEIIKMMLVIGIFLYALLKLESIEPLVLFGAYLVALGAGAIFPIFVKN